MGKLIVVIGLLVSLFFGELTYDAVTTSGESARNANLIHKVIAQENAKGAIVDARLGAALAAICQAVEAKCNV